MSLKGKYKIIIEKEGEENNRMNVKDNEREFGEPKGSLFSILY